MKKLLTTILMILCWSIVALPVDAANWFKILDFQQEVEAYIDRDSLNYDRTRGEIHCWQRLDCLGDGSVLEQEVYYNLQNNTMAVAQRNFSAPMEEPTHESFAQLEYKPITKAAYGQDIYHFLQLVQYLEDNSINWEYNDLDIPEPSSLESPDWELVPPDFVYDTATAYADDYVETYWSSRQEKLDYFIFVKADQSFAVPAQCFLQNGQMAITFRYPLLIWSDAEGALPQPTQEALKRQFELLLDVYNKYSEVGGY